MKLIHYLLSAGCIVHTFTLPAQNLVFTGQSRLSPGYYIDRSSHQHEIPSGITLFSFRVNDSIYDMMKADFKLLDTVIYFDFQYGVKGEVIIGKSFQDGFHCKVIIQNKSGDTIDIENLVPFGEKSDHIYLTSTGPWALARAKLFRPGLGPVGVILPDNAWEMGYGAIPLTGEMSLCALARRTSSEKADWRRYRTIIYPGGYVEYNLWMDEYRGEWQNGIRLMFRDRYLYDVTEFDETLYNREDLKWIRNDYIIGLQFAWNKEYYDWNTQQYAIDGFLAEGEHLFGGYDVLGLWPTWPRLGVDERNQWDLFSDLPGGLEKIRMLSKDMKEKGTRFFICYNPWDESTRSENPYLGMARLIEGTDADGVVLDCHGASSYELQKAADSIKPGVVMYSEGMAVVKDMPGIVSGRVHDAIYLPPPLNLNKLIRYDFAIFRVCQLRDGRIKREASIAFFNGYGTELNSFAPGRSEAMKDDLVYLGKTTRILRENTSNFLVDDWTPLLPAIRDSIWVNKWPLGNKTLYTVLSMVPEGYSGPLFEDQTDDGYHLVSLWHHEEREWTELEGRTYIPVHVESFNRYDLDTRAEGSIDCIAKLPRIIQAEIREGRLHVSAGQGEEVRVWAGNPTYQNKQVVLLVPGNHQLSLTQGALAGHEGKFVVQLFENEELLDEINIHLVPGTPLLISQPKRTEPAAKAPPGMVKVTGGKFLFRAENTDQFIPYPGSKEPFWKEVKSFYMDKYPVTNKDYREFLHASGYHPADTVRFLRHWPNGNIPEGLGDHPVVYISEEDARAYAAWAGKRLPTEVEWQYAAQGNAGLKWPWGNDFDSTLCNHSSGSTTPVHAFPKGKSPFGVMDLTGNVWQLTDDVYDNGTYYFVIMKGGSYYKPTSSWWYVKGGPQPNDWHQQLLLVSPSFDRNSTVGFRCIKNAAE